MRLKRPPAAPPKSPKLKVDIKDLLRMKCWRYLKATGGDAERYLLIQLGDDEQARQLALDEVDEQMRAANWDDMRWWRPTFRAMAMQAETEVRGNREIRRLAAAVARHPSEIADRLLELIETSSLGVITLDQLLAELQISKRTYFAWEGLGLTPPRLNLGHGHLSKGRRTIRFQVASVVRWLDAQEELPPLDLPAARLPGRPRGPVQKVILQQIDAALAKTTSVRAAARLLGVSHAALNERLKKAVEQR